MINSLLNGQIENHLLPFMWQHGEDEATLRTLVGKIQESGAQALCVESRPHPDFLGASWWRDMDILMDECRGRGMDVWLLDDSHFPSGYANGAAEHSYYRKLYLKETHYDILGGQTGTALIVRPDGSKPYLDGEGIFAVIAARRIDGKNMNHDTHVDIEGVPVQGPFIDLTEKITDGVIYFDLPQGLWRIFILETTRTYAPRRDVYVNPITAQGGKLLLDTVYEPHYQRYKEDFGKTFKGFFADEPQFGNAYGYHSKIGRTPQMVLPWSDDLPGLMQARLGANYRTLLPGLWYDIGEKRPEIQVAYMDIITRLYGQNFAGQIGDWCRAHGVAYIGHVIEDNNAHTRLGAGTGHFFRALWGQDFSGIDIVLHEIVPGIKNGSHKGAAGLEYDDNFFHYGLAQLGNSLAQIDPKKKGRTMCEIFGAFGWQEGLCEMKWMADFMLARGVNYFVPHAFSPKAFPDPDCPPHFYAHGQNPQFRYFKRLMDYMNRVSSLISGGRHLAQAAVLYHAEAEWAGPGSMNAQFPVKELTQHQIQSNIIPADVLENAPVVDGVLHVGMQRYRLLIVPRAPWLPDALMAQLARLCSQGLAVWFVEAAPKGWFAQSESCAVVPLNALASHARQFLSDDARVLTNEPELMLYAYQKDQSRYLLLFNEGIEKTIRTQVALQTNCRPIYYDAFENRAYPAEYTVKDGKTTVWLTLPPFGAVVLALEPNPCPDLSPLPVLGHPFAQLDHNRWQVSLATAEQYPHFSPTETISGPENLSAPGKLPRFSGTIRYETTFEGVAKGLDLGTVGEIAQVWVNGHDCGIRCQKPYAFEIDKYVQNGNNKLVIEVTNTLVYQIRDRMSAFVAMGPSGLCGPVMLTRS